MLVFAASELILAFVTSAIDLIALILKPVSFGLPIEDLFLKL